MKKCEYCYKSASLWKCIRLVITVLVLIAIAVTFVSCMADIPGGYTVIGKIEDEYDTFGLYYIYSDVTHLVYIYYGRYPSMCPVYKTATEVYTYKEFLKDYPEYKTDK